MMPYVRSQEPNFCNALMVHYVIPFAYEVFVLFSRSVASFDGVRKFCVPDYVTEYSTYAIRVNKKTRHIMYPNRQLEDES